MLTHHVTGHVLKVELVLHAVVRLACLSAAPPTLSAWRTAALNIPLSAPLELAFTEDPFGFRNPDTFGFIGPACVLPCTRGSSDVTGDVRRRLPDATGDVRCTGLRDRAQREGTRMPAGQCPAQQGSVHCPAG